MVFGVDDIHALRVELAKRRAQLPKPEAERDFRSRVERGRQAIEEARKNRTTEQSSTGGRTRKPVYGSGKGKMWISEDFDAPLEELREYME